MRKKLTAIIKGFIRKPNVTMGVGIVLIICGLFETTETALENFFNIDVGAGHGIILLGIIQILHSIVITIEGIENVGLASEEQKLEEEIKNDKD